LKNSQLTSGKAPAISGTGREELRLDCSMRDFVGEQLYPVSFY
jgi:hypothetical protein